MSLKSSSTHAFELLRQAVSAMATRFELVLPVDLSGPRVESLRAAGEAALAEIVEVENWLSIYRPTSQIATVNARASREPVRVAPPVFALLEQAREWSRRTANAFDPTVGSLVRVWREMSPANSQWSSCLETARGLVGWQHVELNDRLGTVRFLRPGVQLDLGSIGKGWAVDRAVECLREAGVTRALLHGGTSTVSALGSPPDRGEWLIELAHAPNPIAASPHEPIRVPLCDGSLSVSATWGRTHPDAAGRFHGHVLDPRTGEPVIGPRRAAVRGPSALMTDVLSTALLVTGEMFRAELPDFGADVQGWYD